MKIRYVPIAVAGMLIAAGASAQNMKPGLWEVTNNMKSGSGGQMEQAQVQMQQQMAKMTPEQKKMMQDMMAKQGMQMGSGPGGGMSVKTCITKEMAARDELPMQQGDCRTTNQQKSGNTMKFAVACANPPSTGEGQVTLTSPEAFSMRMAVQSKAGGQSHTVNMEGTGRWLSADCGSVKPMPMGPAGGKK